MSRLAAFTRPPTDPRSDGALLAAFLTDRDEPAFAELVRRHGPLVWATCRRALPDSHDAEDAFQATFLVLVRRASHFTAADSLGPWLYRVAAWTGRALRRKNARRRAVVGPLPESVADSRAAVTVELDDLLLALPDRYRSAVVLCHLQGLTHREAADRLGCAEGTVASLVSRALAKLRTKLTSRDPAALLALAATAVVPAELSAGAVRSAAAFQFTTLSAAATPAVARLTEGVLRMFWVKKAASVAAAMVLVAGLGIGFSVQQGQRAVADDPPAKPAATNPPANPRADDPALIRAEMELLRREAERTELELKRLMKQADDLTAQAQVVQTARDDVVKRYKDLVSRQEVLERGRAGGADGAGAADPFELVVGSPRAAHPYSFIEREPNGDAGLLAYAPTEAGLRKYLARMQADPKAPKSLTISAARDAPYDRVAAAVYAAKAAGFRHVRLTGHIPVDADFLSGVPTAMKFGSPEGLNFDLVKLPTEKPIRRRNLGGDGPPGGEFHENLAVGETLRIAVHGGRQNDPLPSPPDFLRWVADAEGLIVTGLKPGVTRVTVRDTKGRDHTIRIQVEHAKP